MKIKEIELLEKVDDIKLGHFYSEEEVNEDDRKYYKVVYAFKEVSNTTTTEKRADCGNPNLNVTTNVLGVEVNIMLKDILGKYNYYNLTLGKIKEDYPKVYEYLKGKLKPNFIEKYNEALELKRNAYTSKVQKLYDNLYKVFSELGYKQDIKKLEEINELLYCEAEPFLLQIQDRIYERKNPKNIRAYKKLSEIKEQDIIECEV